MSQRAMDGGATNVQDGRTDICSCNICTSTIPGGRMSRCQGWQGATHAYMDVGKGREQERKLCPWMGGMPQGAKDGGVAWHVRCHNVGDMYKLTAW